MEYPKVAVILEKMLVWNPMERLSFEELWLLANDQDKLIEKTALTEIEFLESRI